MKSGISDTEMVSLSLLIRRGYRMYCRPTKFIRAKANPVIAESIRFITTVDIAIKKVLNKYFPKGSISHDLIKLLQTIGSGIHCGGKNKRSAASDLSAVESNHAKGISRTTQTLRIRIYSITVSSVFLVILHLFRFDLLQNEN